MSTPLQVVGDWGHALAAALFAVLAIWTARRIAGQRIGKLLVAALTLTSIWSLAIAFRGVARMESGLMEDLRNCGWLVCLSLFPMQTQMRHVRGAWPLYVVLALLVPAQYVLYLAGSVTPLSARMAAQAQEGRLVLHLLWTVGALILTQRVCMNGEGTERRAMAPLVAAMAMMWGYDLLLYAAGLVVDGEAMPLLFALRGVVMLAPALAIALMLRDRAARPVQASRALTWYGLWAAGVVMAMVAVAGGLALVDSIASPVIRALLTGGLFAAVAGALLLMSGTRVSALLKLWFAKHLFRHRYDYREQWMAFIDTIDSAGASGMPLQDRLLKAMADITASSGAVLLMLDEETHFRCERAWNWKGEEPARFRADARLLGKMRERAWIADIGQMRLDGEGTLTDWLARDRTAWALVPLLHFGKLDRKRSCRERV